MLWTKKFVEKFIGSQTQSERWFHAVNSTIYEKTTRLSKYWYSTSILLEAINPNDGSKDFPVEKLSPQLIIQIGLRTSSLQFKRLIWMSFICNFFWDKKWQMSFSEIASLSNTNYNGPTLVECCSMSLLVHFTLGGFSRKFRQQKETNDVISDTCCRWNHKLFKLNLTYRILLHWIGAINRLENHTVQKSCLKPFNICIVILHAYLTLHTSAWNWMNLSESMSAGLIYQKNEPVRRFKISVETLLLSRSIALLRALMTFILKEATSQARPYEPFQWQRRNP